MTSSTRCRRKKSNFTSVENVTLFLHIFIAGDLSACVTFLESIEAGHAPLRPPGIVTATRRVTDQHNDGRDDDGQKQERDNEMERPEPAASPAHHSEIRSVPHHAQSSVS